MFEEHRSWVGWMDCPNMWIPIPTRENEHFFKKKKKEKMNITTSLPQETMYIFACASRNYEDTSLLKILNSLKAHTKLWNCTFFLLELAF